jgi:hypothetical protein
MMRLAERQAAERRTARAKRRRTDLTDDLAAFAGALQGWCWRDGPHAGYPFTWLHYVYGQAHLNRRRARAVLDLHDAMAAAQAMPGQAKRDWLRAWQAAAEH